MIERDKSLDKRATPAPEAAWVSETVSGATAVRARPPDEAAEQRALRKVVCFAFAIASETFTRYY